MLLKLCRDKDFEARTFQCCFRKISATKTLLTRKQRKHPKALRLGPFLAAGPLMAALAGAGVGGAAGGLAGALIGAGIPEYEAKRYEGRIRKGGILLSVHCDNSEWASKAKNILENTGADDVSSTSEASADFARSDKPMPRIQV
jgi:hypothetical protein